MTSTAFEAGVNLAKISIGTGILALPFATVHSGGLLLSPVINAGIAVLNGISSAMMIRCRKCIDREDIPDTISSTYSQIAYAAFGIHGARLVDTCVSITLFGVCTTYLIAASEMMETLPYVSLSTDVWIRLIALIVYPLSCLKSVDRLAAASFWGIILLLLSVMVVVMFGLNAYHDGQRQNGGEDVEHALMPTGFVGVMNYIGIATFCYGQCSIIFPVEQSMRDKSQIMTAVAYCLSFVWLVYAFVGNFVAVLYMKSVDGVQSNILLNLPEKSPVSQAVSLLMVGVCILSYPLTMFPVATTIEKWLVSSFPMLSSSQENAEYLPLSIELHDRDRACYNRDNSSKQSPGNVSLVTSSLSSSPMPSSLRTNGEAATSQTSTIERYEPHILARCMCRFVLVMLTAQLGIGIPCFALLINVLGSGTISIVSYILPPLLHSVLVTNKTLTCEEGGNNSNMNSLIKEFKAKDFFSPTQQLWIDRSLLMLGLSLTVIATSVTFVSVYFQLVSPNPQC